MAGGRSGGGGRVPAELSAGPRPRRCRRLLSRVLKPLRGSVLAGRLGEPAPVCKRQGIMVLPFFAESHGPGEEYTLLECEPGIGIDRNHCHSGSASLFSRADFCLFLFRAPFFHEAQPFPKHLPHFWPTTNLLTSKRQERKSAQCEEGLSHCDGATLEGQSHREEQGREQGCDAVGARGRCSLELRAAGKAAIPAHRRACCCLAAESSRSVWRVELGWKLVNVPRRAEKIERLVPPPLP